MLIEQVFEVLSQTHAKDKDNAYFAGRIIEGADIQSFASVTGAYAHDHKTLWRDETPLHTFDQIAPDSITVFSDSILSVGKQPYFAGQSLIPLAETPQTEINEYCRDWFTMNGALWFAGQRIGDIDNITDVFDCDVSTRTASTGEEMIEDNHGILFRTETAIFNARLDGTL